jgi:hypothetical protein
MLPAIVITPSECCDKPRKNHSQPPHRALVNNSVFLRLPDIYQRRVLLIFMDV